jgi:peroxiredoxin
VLVWFLFGLGFMVPVWGQAPASALNVGDKAPVFEGRTAQNSVYQLKKAIEQGPVVLVFYRGAWCPYCRKHLSELQDSLQRLTALGASVVAITPETYERIELTQQKTKARFTIIHDSTSTIAKAYGVNFELAEAKAATYKLAGINLTKFNGENGNLLPVPATYIIDTAQIIRYVFYDPDYTKRASVSELVKTLQELRGSKANK